MQPLVALRCGDEARRRTIVAALERSGIELTDPVGDLAAIHVVEDERGFSLRSKDELLLQLSAPLSAEDVAGLAQLGLELTTLWGLVRSFEDSESVGVVAANVAHDARNALVPVMFAADAIAIGCPAAKELTNLLLQGCMRVESVLKRITPAEPAAPPKEVCANTVINDLGTTMRALAHRATLVTRLETPLGPVVIEQPDLERVLLTLIANAADSRRHCERIVVATSARKVIRSEPQGAPTGHWVVIEVEDDGDKLDDAAIERALRPTFGSSPSPPRTGLGLRSVTQVVRAAGGWVSFDSAGRGTRIAIWLPHS